MSQFPFKYCASVNLGDIGSVTTQAVDLHEPEQQDFRRQSGHNVITLVETLQENKVLISNKSNKSAYK